MQASHTIQVTSWKHPVPLLEVNTLLCFRCDSISSSTWLSLGLMTNGKESVSRGCVLPCMGQITFAPYGRALSPGRKMAAPPLFHRATSKRKLWYFWKVYKKGQTGFWAVLFFCRSWTTSFLEGRVWTFVWGGVIQRCYVISDILCCNRNILKLDFDCVWNVGGLLAT